MARVCTHCGELYPERRLNCPHCGADADQPWTEGDHEPDWGFDVDDGRMDDAGYAEFLRREGLAPDRPAARGGRPLSRRRLAVLLLLLGAAALLLYAILIP